MSSSSPSVRTTSLIPLPEMPLLPITSEATVQACQSLPVTNQDIFICSYPKSGTTWTQNLVCRLLACHLRMELPEDWHLSHSAPFYEVDRYWNKVDGSRVPVKTPLVQKSDSSTEITTYRVFNTHLRPQQLPDQAKCIYIMRDPLDVMASFYYHLANMAEKDGGYAGSPEMFVKDFVDGTVLYGKWQDHMESWLGGKKSMNNGRNQTVLLLHYKDMKTDLTKEAIKVARFLGMDDHDLDDVIKTAVDHCTFNTMRKERWRYTPQSVDWKVDHKGEPYQDFVRAGRIGDGPTFFQKYATPDVHDQWKRDLKTAIFRWNQVGVDAEIIEQYLEPNG